MMYLLFCHLILSKDYYPPKLYVVVNNSGYYEEFGLLNEVMSGDFSREGERISMYVDAGLLRLDQKDQEWSHLQYLKRRVMPHVEVIEDERATVPGYKYHKRSKVIPISIFTTFEGRKVQVRYPSQVLTILSMELAMDEVCSNQYNSAVDFYHFSNYSGVDKYYLARTRETHYEYYHDGYKSEYTFRHLRVACVGATIPISRVIRFEETDQETVFRTTYMYDLNAKRLMLKYLHYIRANVIQDDRLDKDIEQLTKSIERASK